MVGIIGEYNPFHNGHLYHIKKVKAMFPNETICLVLVGNFLNRGDISIIEKYDKTRLALKYGIDLIVELPTSFAIQAADIYAFGAISILTHLKCNYLVFGSESNDLKTLTKIADIQINKQIDLNEYIKQGYNYPTSLSLALQKHIGIKIDSPNDLSEGFRKIPEPDAKSPVYRESPDTLVIVPGTVFDRCGHRIGYGGGYYDRFLAGLSKSSEGPFFVGVCFSCQLAENICPKPHDVPMDLVIFA